MRGNGWQDVGLHHAVSPRTGARAVALLRMRQSQGPIPMNRYSKLIAAAITLSVILGRRYGIEITDELVAAVTDIAIAVSGLIFVYEVPNEE